MPLTISCIDLGSPCHTEVSGESLDEIIEQMRKHAIEVHNEPREKVYGEEVTAMFRSAVKQSSRPAGSRSSKLDV